MKYNRVSKQNIEKRKRRGNYMQRWGRKDARGCCVIYVLMCARDADDVQVHERKKKCQAITGEYKVMEQTRETGENRIESLEQAE
jgi:hypothetical protein